MSSRKKGSPSFVKGIEEGLLTLLLLTMVLLAFLQIVLRNLFGTGLVWADPLSRHLLLWLALAGALVATGEERHISVDAIRRLLPRRLHPLASLFGSAFSTLVSAFLTYATFIVFYGEFKTPQGYILQGLPLWASLGVMPIAFLLITLRSARITLITLLSVLKGE